MKNSYKVILFGALLGVMLPVSAMARICILGLCNDASNKIYSVNKTDEVKKTEQKQNDADKAVAKEDKVIGNTAPEYESDATAENNFADIATNEEDGGAPFEQIVEDSDNNVAAEIVKDIECEVGDIYYADDTCSAEVVDGKTPIGVVYDTKFKLVLGLDTPPAELGGLTTRSGELTWCGTGPNHCDDDGYTGLRHAIGEPRGGDMTLKHFDMEGKKNTELLVAYSIPYAEGKNFTGKDHPAAQYCYNLKTGGEISAVCRW